MTEELKIKNDQLDTLNSDKEAEVLFSDLRKACDNYFEKHFDNQDAVKSFQIKSEEFKNKRASDNFKKGLGLFKRSEDNMKEIENNMKEVKII